LRRIIRGFPFQIKGLAMPIYAYRCATCGHAKDVLQKMSDPVLTVCPSCGAATFQKQVTAAGFQLKGSGWYVTDFKGDKKPASSPTGEDKAEGAKSDGANAESAKGDGAKSDGAKAEGAKSESNGSAPASGASKGASAPAPAASTAPPPAAPPTSTK
jgi:putative FmdB family regulatory protein